ncbi:MAG: glycerophosphodiester phosphodiesterase family protein [Flavobacteriales bacterium]
MAPPDRILFLCLSAALSACMPQKNLHPDVHGHRGCRGSLPENSIPAFVRAVDIGCDVLEMDVVLTADDQVIVSHEPWIDHVICRTADGDAIAPEDERSLNIFRMNLAEVRSYDCGSAPNPDFPEQDDRPVHKPTLREVIEVVEEHALLSGNVSPSYNIEIKSDPEWYGTFQPLPDAYARRVIAEIDALGITDRCIVQSFDPAILEVIHAERPDMVLALLVENDDGLRANLSRLTFIPQYYSPHFSQADEGLLKDIRQDGMELVVWTVNKKEDIQRMLDLGVDGIISDYPERVIALMGDR